MITALFYAHLPCYSNGMKVQIITLFPDMFKGIFDASMLFKARQKKLLEIELINLRDFGLGPRKQVDDTPYGGGDGMLLRPEPIAAAIKTAKASNPAAQVILLTPAGREFKQALASQLATRNGLVLVCGRYEGVDERVSTLADMELSVGNYVLTGGEIPAMIVVDAVSRLIPGVLGGQNSAKIESFADGRTVEYPQYTKPETWQGQSVPPVLLSGNHQAIDKWRRQAAAKKTAQKERQ